MKTVRDKCGHLKGHWDNHLNVKNVLLVLGNQHVQRVLFGLIRFGISSIRELIQVESGL